jgi:hypothetical protein
MANLIRLKQIESGSALQTSAAIGTDFSQSVIDIIQDNVAATLPDGIVSGSSQIFITGTIGYNDIATDLEVAVISSSLSASQVLISSSISSSIAATLSGSALSVTALSQSVSASLRDITTSYTTTASFHSYTASLGDTFATDLEVYLTSSNIIDQGEF